LGGDAIAIKPKQLVEAVKESAKKLLVSKSND
jgi:hypothetical protein